MTTGIITGSGTYASPGLAGGETAEVATRFGAARLTAGRLAAATSQTAGPETVLAGEAALPYALLGYD